MTKSDDEYTQVQMVTSFKASSGIKKTSLKKFKDRDNNRGNFVVFNRTLLINVDKGILKRVIIGVITKFDWAPTTCIGDVTSLTIDDICGYQCDTTNRCNANITVCILFCKF